MKWKEIMRMNGLEAGKQVMKDYIQYGNAAELSKIYKTSSRNISNFLEYWENLLSKAYPKTYKEYIKAYMNVTRHKKDNKDVVDTVIIESNIFKGLPKQISYTEFVDHMINSNVESSVSNLMSLAEKEGIKIIG